MLVEGDAARENKIVYIKKKSGLIVHRLEIYVDRPVIDTEADFKLTRVSPVDLDGRKFSNIGATSVHCGKTFDEEARRDPARTTVSDVNFVCNPDSQQHSILIGERDGTEILSFTGNDGDEFTLTIVYSDLTAYPGDGDLRAILESFEII